MSAKPQTLAELRAATRAFVRAEIARLLGRDLSTEEARAAFDDELEVIVNHVGSGRFWDGYLTTAKEFIHDAPAAIRLLRALREMEPTSEDGSILFANACRYAKAPEVGFLLSELENLHELQPWKSSPRAIIAAMIGPRWWWDTDRPSNRDLALVSLLVGNFPDLPRGEAITLDEVIEREMDAIASHRRRRKARNRRE